MHRIADTYGGHMLKKKLIISPFNLVFWFTSLFFVGVLTVMTLTVKGRDIGFRKTFYIAVCLFNCVSFFLYKYELSRDREYDKERQFIGGFNWWGAAAASVQYQYDADASGSLFRFQAADEFLFLHGTSGSSDGTVIACADF